MFKVDRDNGGYTTTTGKQAWPARHYWWDITGYDVETDMVVFMATFETEEAAQAAYDEIKAQKGAKVLTEEGRPDLEYVIVDGVEYVLNACDEQTVYLDETKGHATLDI
jgi:hypothetical protein